MFDCRSYFWTGTKKIIDLEIYMKKSVLIVTSSPSTSIDNISHIAVDDDDDDDDLEKSAIDYDVRLQRKRTTPSFQQPTRTTTLTDTTYYRFFSLLR